MAWPPSGPPSPTDTLQAEKKTGGDAWLKDRFCQCLFLLGLGFNLFVTLRWAGQPLLDQHNFRQTQTAISAWWLAAQPGWGHWLNYETPVFGSPWQIPLEFPVFQWVVAGVHVVTAIPWDPLGRALSALFFYAILWPLGMLARDFGLSRRSFYLGAGMLLVSPVYLYWSRAFLIESTALFFSFLFLAWFKRYLRSCQARYIILATSAGLLAVLTKVTTVLPFATGAAMLLVSDEAMRPHWRQPWRSLKLWLPVLCCALVCAFCLAVWVRHTAEVTSTSYFGKILVPANLHFWTYGSLAQRLSAEFWRETLWKRALSETVGSRWVLLGWAWAAFGLGLRACRLPTLLMGLFLLPMLVFTNLQVVHNYYLYANGVFLVLAGAIGLARWSEKSSSVLFVLICTAAVFAEVRTFVRTYLPSVRADFSSASILKVASFVRRETSPDSVLVVVGCDWNPAVAYCCERRAIYIPPWAAREQIETVLREPARFTSGKPVGGVVECCTGWEARQTGAWRDFVRQLEPESKVARFGPYRAVLPRSTNVWRQTYLTDSLSGEQPGTDVWAGHLPYSWSKVAPGKAARVTLEEAWLEGRRLPHSAAPMIVSAGSSLRLVFSSSTQAVPQLILRLCGTNWWATRYTWLQTGSSASISVAGAPKPLSSFECVCHIPAGLPEDNYALSLVTGPGQPAVQPLWLTLHVLAPWSTTPPPGWPNQIETNCWGLLSTLTVDGEKAEPSRLETIRPLAVLQMQGWLAVLPGGQQDTDLLLALVGPASGGTYYVPAQRCWWPEFDLAMGKPLPNLCGFRIAAMLPPELPSGDYRAKILQKAGPAAAQFELPMALRIR